MPAYRTPGEPVPQPPDSTPDFAGANRRRRRTLAIGAGVGLAVIAAGAAVAITAAQHAQAQAVSAATTQLDTCLFQQPLEASESPGMRFRRLQLGAVAGAERPAADKAWPGACAQPARRVLDAMRAAGASDADVKAVAELARLLDDPGAVLADLTAPVDAATAAVSRLAPAVAVSGGDPLPPRALLTVDDLRAVKPLSKDGTSLGRTFTEDNPGLSLPVLIDDKDLPDAPLLCTFRESAATASCRSLRGLVADPKQGMRLLGTSDEDAEPLVFAGRRGSEGIFAASTGRQVDALYSYGGYAKSDGSSAILGWDEKASKLVLSRQHGADPAQRVKLVPDFRVGNYFYGSQLLWDRVLVRGVTKSNQRRLFVLAVDDADARGFAPADVGELAEPGLIAYGDEETAHITGCRTPDMVVVRVRGTSDDFLTFRTGDHFSAPVPVPPEGLLGCHGSTATLVLARGRSVEHDACTSAGCTATRVSARQIDREWPWGDLRNKPVRAVDLGGSLLAVWAAGDRGGLRMRMAKPDLFAKAKDVVVFDDLVSGGKMAGESTLLGFRLFARGKFAVLLVSTLAGLHALRIDADGSVRPWPARP